MKVRDITITNQFKKRFEKEGLRMLLADWDGLIIEKVFILPTKLDFCYGVQLQGIWKGTPLMIEQSLDGTIDFRYGDTFVQNEEFNEREITLSNFIVKETNSIYKQLGAPTLEWGQMQGRYEHENR